jgi:hypothetical protein
MSSSSQTPEEPGKVDVWSLCERQAPGSAKRLEGIPIIFLIEIVIVMVRITLCCDPPEHDHVTS